MNFFFIKPIKITQKSYRLTILLLSLATISCSPGSGGGDNTPQNNVWTWVSGSNLNAQRGIYGRKGIPNSENMPGSRSGAASWIDGDGNLWLFGGYGNGSTSLGQLNDLWRWDGSNWTWISGSDTVNHNGVFGVKGVADEANMPPGRHSAISWVGNDGSLWLFGGGGEPSTNAVNTLWRWDGENWTWISGSNTRSQIGVYGVKGVPDPANVPGARYDSASWVDADGNFWLFGGRGYDSTGVLIGELNDLWRWDGTNWTWISGSNSIDDDSVYGVKGVADSANVPGARFGSASWVDEDGNLWLFGGYQNYDGPWGPGFRSAGYLNDLWRWDGTDWTWISGSNALGAIGVYGVKGVADSTNMPGARFGAVSWLDAEGNFWLFGGNGSDSEGVFYPLNDLWRWDGLNWTWVSGSEVIVTSGSYGTKGVADYANIPHPRIGAVSWITPNGDLWLFGGDLAGTTFPGIGILLNDLCRYQP